MTSALTPQSLTYSKISVKKIFIKIVTVFKRTAKVYAEYKRVYLDKAESFEKWNKSAAGKIKEYIEQIKIYGGRGKLKPDLVRDSLNEKAEKIIMYG